MSEEVWPYLVPRPGRGQVRACPVCGSVAMFNCWHPERGRIPTTVMNAAKAAHLRRTSGEYNRREYECVDCGYKGPMERGSTIGEGWHCARCPGRTERQVTEARGQVALV